MSTPKQSVTRSAADYRTVKQAAEYVPWADERALRRLIAAGRLPVSRVGGRVLVCLADLDELVAS